MDNGKTSNQPRLLSLVEKVPQPETRSEGDLVLDALRTAISDVEEAIKLGLPPSHVVICMGTWAMKDGHPSFMTEWVTGNITDLSAVGLLTTIARDLMGG